MKYFFLFIVCCFFSSNAFSQHKGGLILQSNASMQGYVLFAPLHSKTTYLIDKCGRQIHTWQSNYMPGQSVYLMANGDLLRTANDSNKTFKGGGIIERYNWKNKLLWSYKISSSEECQHHDICALPNGNILVLVWERKSSQEAINAGRNPKLASELVWSEKIVELQPEGKTSAKVVWEWHVWDHLIQDFDSTKNNYGKVSENPQLLDINYYPQKEPDWFHFNSLAYNPTLDQILVSNRNYNEIFILDHSSAKDAASHNGGKSGKGGDLLYRFGNPRAFHSGTEADQILFSQHNAHWIESGLKDEGKILLFNNGLGRRLKKNYSSIELITPGFDDKKNYLFKGTERAMLYSEKENDETGGSFFSPNVSSAQRLSNGNLLVCSGATGRFCELTENKDLVWLYMNPVSRSGITPADNEPDMNQVFRCTFYPTNYKAFKGKKLTPLNPIEKQTAGDCYPVSVYSPAPTGR